MIQFFPVDDKLRNFIKEYWLWENINPSNLPWILPTSEPEVVFHLTKPPILETDIGSNIYLEDFHLVGPQNRRWRICTQENMSLFSIRFYPGTLYELLGISGEEITNNFDFTFSHEVQRQWNKISIELKEIGNKKSINVCKINKIILDIFELGLGKDIPAYIKFSITDFVKGNNSIESVSKKMNISRKQLERKFKEIVGLTPKEFQRIHRLLNLIRNPQAYKDVNSRRKLTDIAYEMQYSDQSHMIKDFTSLTGILPKVWLQDFDKMSLFYNSRI